MSFILVPVRISDSVENAAFETLSRVTDYSAMGQLIIVTHMAEG
jgi:hypothetical protein